MGEILAIHKNLGFGITLLAFCGKSWHRSFPLTMHLINNNNNNNIYFRTKIQNIYAYTITNIAYQPITREMFEIGPRIRSKTLMVVSGIFSSVNFAYKKVEMTISKKVQILYKNVRKIKV